MNTWAMLPLKFPRLFKSFFHWRRDLLNQTAMTKHKKGTSLELLFLKSLLCVALLLFTGGIISPIMTITQLVFIENRLSILSTLYDLLQHQKYLLFVIITLLSFILPSIKIAILGLILQGDGKGQKANRLLNLMHNYGRWAMLDVFVVAILLVSIKLSAIASIEIHFGLYLFAGSILITMWVTHRTVILFNCH